MPTPAAIPGAPTLELPGLGCWSDSLDEHQDFRGDKLGPWNRAMPSSEDATHKGWLCASLLFLLPAPPTFSLNSSLLFITKDQWWQFFLSSSTHQWGPSEQLSPTSGTKERQIYYLQSNIFQGNVWKIVSDFWIFQIWEATKGLAR